MLPLFQVPGAGDAIIGGTLHIMRTNLNFRELVIQAENGCVQGLVAIQLRCGDKVFDATILRPPQSMDMAERQVAVLNRVNQDAEGDEVMDPRQLLSHLNNVSACIWL